MESIVGEPLVRVKIRYGPIRKPNAKSIIPTADNSRRNLDSIMRSNAVFNYLFNTDETLDDSIITLVATF